MIESDRDKAALNPALLPKGKLPQLVRGMKDILPQDAPFWDRVRSVVAAEAGAARYEPIETPILEETPLFTRSIGRETDVVEKEMYSFTDEGEENLTLRPEGTAGVVRAYVEHGMVNLPQPVRLWYWGPFFRRDRPQAGRFRQFHQFGLEVIGDGHPVIDSQLIQLGYRIFQELGLPVSLQVNSLGDSLCRPAYEKLLQEYYRKRRNNLCEDCKRRLAKSPLRLLDCKVPDCQTLAVDAPQFVDHLDEACRQHFVQVLEQLDELEIPYTLNPKVVRGLDYYTRTTFEFWIDEADGKPLELGGGGRYDGLIERFSGRQTPAAGFACGVERIVLKLKELNLVKVEVRAPDVFLAQLGDAPRKKALKLFGTLREAGFTVVEAFSKNSVKAQMEIANRLAAKFTLIVGQKEIMDGTILLRDMENGIQEVVEFGNVVPELKKRLLKNGGGKGSEPARQPSP